MSANTIYPKDLFESDRQCKDKQITAFLKRLPSLDFTNTGIGNICKRFNITPDQLSIYITNLGNNG